MQVKFTHYGWFGFCPAKFAEIESGMPFIEPRWKCLDWLMTLSEKAIDLYISYRCRMHPETEPMYPLRISGEYKKPKIEYFPDEGCDL